MARIAGTYTTQRDGGLTYSYEATWHECGDGVVWSAKVRRSGESAGAPTGQIRKTAGIPIEGEVRRVVETAIETRSGMKR